EEHQRRTTHMDTWTRLRGVQLPGGTSETHNTHGHMDTSEGGSTARRNIRDTQPTWTRLRGVQLPGGTSETHNTHGGEEVEEQLREEDFIERCFEELWEEEEERESFIPSRDLPHLQGIQSELPLLQGIQSDVHKDADYPIYSRLNPNAKEFTPGIQKHVM
ncbi:Polyadenylate-binding protein-interacting protein 2B, partial [Dissostichus eleginoides]